MIPDTLDYTISTLWNSVMSLAISSFCKIYSTLTSMTAFFPGHILNLSHTLSIISYCSSFVCLLDGCAFLDLNLAILYPALCTVVAGFSVLTTSSVPRCQLLKIIISILHCTIISLASEGLLFLAYISISHMNNPMYWKINTDFFLHLLLFLSYAHIQSPDTIMNSCVFTDTKSFIFIWSLSAIGSPYFESLNLPIIFQTYSYCSVSGHINFSLGLF